MAAVVAATLRQPECGWDSVQRPRSGSTRKCSSTSSANSSSTASSTSSRCRSAGTFSAARVLHAVGAVLAMVWILAVSLVAGGPDPSPLSYCGDLMKALNQEDRHAARVAVQALQAVQSYLGHLQLGRPLPLSSVKEAAPSKATLEGWKAGNASVLQQLLEGAGVVERLGSSETAAALAGSCLSSRLVADGFAGRPVVSVLLEYFKRPFVVRPIASILRAACAAVDVPCELVVNVDNPHEAGAWAAEAEGGFVVPVFSNNVHEARGYNRAAKVARGRYLVMWQDDQLPPQRPQWLVDLTRVFDAHPTLAVLGMNKYRLCRHVEFNNRVGPTEWAPDERTGVAWSYVQYVDFAPLAVRAEVFKQLGGLEEGWSRPGDCGITGDWELCTRAWMGGWQVGYMYLGGRAEAGMGGTHLPVNAEACWGRQMTVGGNTLRARHSGHVLNEVCERVWLLNLQAFSLGLAGHCPYQQRYNYTPWGNCTAPPAAVMQQRLSFPL